MAQEITYKGKAFSITLLLIIGVLAILLWWQSCGKNHGVDPQVAKMQKESDDKYNKLLNRTKEIEDSAKDLRGEKELMDTMFADAAKDLKKLFNENERLRKQHAQEPAPIPFDSNNSIVSNRYVAQCNDCFILNKNMEDSVKAAKRIVDKLGDIHQKQLELKDNEIKVYKNVTAFNKSKYDDLLDKYAKLGKGKASVSMGIEYNYSSAVSEVGAYLMFRTRKGSEVGAGIGGNTMSSWYFSIRAGQKIF